MTKWEYSALAFDYDLSVEERCTWLNDMGDEGWECYAVNGNIAYLRRLKEKEHRVTGPSEYKEAPSV